MINDAENDSPDRAVIFERFQRGDSSRSRHSSSAGWGLAIVKELIQVHGGKVDSEFQTGKATFWFELPDVRDLIRFGEGRKPPGLLERPRGYSAVLRGRMLLRSVRLRFTDSLHNQNVIVTRLDYRSPE